MPNNPRFLPAAETARSGDATRSKKPPVALDVAGTIKNLGELVVRRTVEPALGGGPLWDKGLGDVVGAMVDQCNLPASVSALDVGRALGLVKKRGGRR